MSAQDWYRRTTWTEVDREEFEARLASSRSGRSEYLRIQAVTLEGTTDLSVGEAALDLSARFLEENPEGFGRAQMHVVRARIFVRQRRIDDGVAAYRAAIREEAGLRYSSENAHIEFAWMVATEGIEECYDEVVATLDTSTGDGDLTLPYWQYRYYGALALIAEAFGDRSTASRMAANAMAAAGQPAGPFEGHPGVGVVVVQDQGTHARLGEMSG